MKRFFVVTTYCALVLIICSCGKSKCLNPTLHLTFQGYDTTELSQVLVSQYTSNGSFSTLVSIKVFDTANTQIRQSSDTIYMPYIDTFGVDLAPGYDYIVSLPHVKKIFSADTLFKIMKISYTEVNRGASGSASCTNDVSYYLDSIPHKISGAIYTQTFLPPVKVVLNK